MKYLAALLASFSFVCSPALHAAAETPTEVQKTDENEADNSSQKVWVPIVVAVVAVGAAILALVLVSKNSGKHG